jgi:2',3'-cyclic-nucleotide 2'-phosphodiesterase (5'-nucleotidase family)
MRLRTRNRWLALGIVLLVLTLILPMAALASPPSPNANDNAFYRTVTVVSTNDFHGALVGRVHSWSHGDAVGGAEWLAGYLNIVREEDIYGFLYLDAGDSMQGTLISNYFDGASTIDVFNEMDLDAMAIGNHEFDWGQEVLAEREDQARFPLLAANIFYEGTTTRPEWATPYIVKQVKDINVGIIGVANPDTPSISNPANVAGLDFTDPDDAVNDLIDGVEAEGATMIVVVAHIGGYWPEFGEIEDFTCSLDSDKVDLVVSGHTHSRIDDVLCDIPVVQAYSSGTAFARVDFTVDLRTGEVASYEMNYGPTSTYQTYYGKKAEYCTWDTDKCVKVKSDREVAAIVDYYEAQIEDIKNELIGQTTAEITRDSCHESVMGDWVTDIMRAYDPSIDFAFTNSGGLRANIDAGDMTFGEVFEAIPFDNTLVLATVNGEELKAVLEEGVGPGDDYCDATLEHGIIQVSGLKFDWDASQPLYSRVSNVRYYDDTLVDLSAGATYTIAVNDFIAAGSDDYPTLPTVPQVNTYELVRDIVVDWVKANSPFDPPPLSGRITP